MSGGRRPVAYGHFLRELPCVGASTAGAEGGPGGNRAGVCVGAPPPAVLSVEWVDSDRRQLLAMGGWSGGAVLYPFGQRVPCEPLGER